MIYQSIFDLLYEVIFEGATNTAWAELVVTILSTCAVIFVFAVPFVIVWRVIKTLCGR